MSAPPTDARLMDGTAVSRALLTESACVHAGSPTRRADGPVWRRCWWATTRPR